jgi:hypothetical protein
MNVTDLFKPMTGRLSLNELKDYVFSRYSHRRAEAQGAKSEWADLEASDLKAYSNEFLDKESLRILFHYDTDWKIATKLQATLFNDQL